MKRKLILAIRPTASRYTISSTDSNRCTKYFYYYGGAHIHSLDEIGAITGTWMVDTTIGSFGIDESTSSFVGFRIKEVLARGIGEVTAVGRTPELDGSIEFEKGFLSRTEIVADLTKLRTDRSMRDSKVQSALNTSTHPQAVFVLEESIPITDNGSIESTASGFLTVNGLTNPG